MVASGDNVGIAWAMVVGAGAASSIGALVVFFVQLASKRLLAASLGFAAGVMLYVSMTEILMQNSLQHFDQAGYSADAAFRLAVACFAGGVLATALLDLGVHKLMHWGNVRRQRRIASNCTSGCQMDGCSQMDLAPADGSTTAVLAVALPGTADPPQHCCCACGAAGTSSGGGGESSDSGSEKDLEMASHSALASTPGACRCQCHEGGGVMCTEECCGPTARRINTGAGLAADQIVPGTEAAEVVAVLQSDPHTQDLLRMSVVTGLAIALHNLPEGLATFVGALESSKVGGSIAAAIAIHNIPEGICVAMPVYYATGSRWKGFFWGSMTGLAEPLGGLIGYLAMSETEPLSFAIVFGIVAGMMVYVCVKELLPSAFRFDPKDILTSTSILCGMAVMAASLVLFTL